MGVNLITGYYKSDNWTLANTYNLNKTEKKLKNWT